MRPSALAHTPTDRRIDQAIAGHSVWMLRGVGIVRMAVTIRPPAASKRTHEATRPAGWLSELAAESLHGDERGGWVETGGMHANCGSKPSAARNRQRSGQEQNFSNALRQDGKCI